MKSDLYLSQNAKYKPIKEIAKSLNINEDELYTYGNEIAKVDSNILTRLKNKEDGKLILVTAITPTPYGEGKTTMSIALADGLKRINKNVIAALREPSVGPVLGLKGTATGGGLTQVIPREKINLHFTGDLHAISSAHNFLSAVIDNYIYYGNELNLDEDKILWPRTLDVNDRALRNVNLTTRKDNFIITAASEIMAIISLATSLNDLRNRLNNILIAYDKNGQEVYLEALNITDSLLILLKDATNPNLVQTLENTPVLIHGGPFANIAHGCNSVIATKTALKLADYVITEAGFGADLGAEKFFDIKCRKAGLKPNAAVVVATIRALKMHGGVAREDLGQENVEAVKKGCTNLARHLRNVKHFGVPAIVAINQFVSDTQAEMEVVRTAARERGAEAVICSHWSDGSKGTEELARQVVKLVEGASDQFAPLYDDDMPLWEKIETIATQLYGASDVQADKSVRNRIKELQDTGYGHLPICIAKTQYSFSTDPNLKGAPSHHSLTVREVRLAAGAEFVVAICGDIMTMPGLPRVPAATPIHLDSEGRIEGLF